MAKTMIASMTDGQIENAVAKLRDALRKHRDEFESEPVQEVLGMPNLGMRLLEPFRKLVEAVSDMIVRYVTSDGRTGEQFIADLEKARYNVGDWAKDVMRKPAFVSTNGQTYQLVVIKGEEFEDDDRITSNIRAEAARRGYLTPPAEVAPLLREQISDEELERMGFWGLVVMHEPITDSDGDPDLLGLDRRGEGRWLDACFSEPGYPWSSGRWFVFLVPQV